ncbi:hypothetical protein B0H17DRAFT_1138352 [Mycena rosella]|uniref:Uncharacterized protein n=1 Tax=Mycena rosella TaxID=1033263 RepID=A0AAD7GCE1_MYCRO|nr:hypothetical protein B0H17DRAFT_1138352 [Mycena rosella]
MPSYTAKGHLLVRNAGDNSVIGYVSKNISPVTSITPDVVVALTVSITLPVGAMRGSQLNLAQVDSSNAFPSFGLAQGGYFYFSSTNDTPAGSSPQEPGNVISDSFGAASSESAIWTIDIVSGTAFPIWINSDGVTAKVQLFIDRNVLHASGDLNAYQAVSGPVTPITFTWVPAV